MVKRRSERAPVAATGGAPLEPPIPAPFAAPAFRALADSSPDVVIAIDQHSTIRFISSAAEEAFGYAPSELIGQSLTLLMPERMRARHLAALARHLDTGERRLDWRRVEFPGLHKDGREIELEVSWDAVHLGGERYFAGFIRHVAERNRALRWFTTQGDVSHAIAGATTLTDAIPAVLRAVCNALSWEVGEFWSLDQDAGLLRCRGTWHSPLLELLDYEGAAASLTFAPGTGLPGNAWTSGEPIWAPDLDADARFSYRQEMVRVGLRAGVAFPIRHAGQVTAVLAFFSRVPQTPDPTLGGMLESLGAQIGDFLARLRAEGEVRSSEERFRALVEWSHDAVLLLDRSGAIEYASQSAATVLGYGPDALVGRDVFGLVHPDDRGAAEAAFARCCAEPEGSARTEFRAQHADGSWRHMEGVAVNRLDDLAVRAVVVNVRDVTDRTQAHAALRASEQRYALAARGANDGLWDWDLETDRMYYSPRWKAMLGHQEGEVGDSPEEWMNRVHPQDVDGLRAAIQAHLTGDSPHFEFEHRILHKEGIYMWVVARGLAQHDDAGKPTRMAGSQTDISDRKGAELRLRDQATRDGLTDLPNRALFTELLTRAVEHADRDATHRFAVLFLDLDRFKVVNDSLGHLVGDQFLIAIAHRLEHCVRPRDTVARLGGDEFAVLLDGATGVQDATWVAERVNQALARPFEIHGHEVFTTVSIGITDSSVGYARAEDALRDADLAMYRAKASGRADYQVFDAAMHADALAQHELETALRRAVERNELLLHYQPIVSLRDRRVASLEALVRWQHPRQGLLPPAQFIPLAEETGLIVPIGQWVLREACRQMADWQHRLPAASGLTISVNVTARQLLQADFLDMLRGILAETGLNPTWLRLEITESALMRDTEAASRVLAQLRAQGIGILLDDFGTGYSSLGYLYSLPIDTLKIDRSFVAAVDLSRQNSDIIEAIASLARALGIDLIAEGVETEQQFTALQALRCRLAQGFYLSRPRAAETVSGWLAQRGSRQGVRLPPVSH